MKISKRRIKKISGRLQVTYLEVSFVVSGVHDKQLYCHREYYWIL